MAGLDIPPGGESAWAYQAGFKNEKSHIIGVGAPSGIEILAGLQKKFTPKSQARKISANPPRSNRGVRYSKISQPPIGFEPLEVHRKPLKATWHKG
jgi:hypothetical protein